MVELETRTSNSICGSRLNDGGCSAQLVRFRKKLPLQCEKADSREKRWEIILPGPLKTHCSYRCSFHSWQLPEAGAAPQIAPTRNTRGTFQQVKKKKKITALHYCYSTKTDTDEDNMIQMFTWENFRIVVVVFFTKNDSFKHEGLFETDVWKLNNSRWGSVVSGLVNMSNHC